MGNETIRMVFAVITIDGVLGEFALLSSGYTICSDRMVYLVPLVSLELVTVATAEASKSLIDGILSERCDNGSYYYPEVLRKALRAQGRIKQLPIAKDPHAVEGGLRGY